MLIEFSGLFFSEQVFLNKTGFILYRDRTKVRPGFFTTWMSEVVLVFFFKGLGV